MSKAFARSLLALGLMASAGSVTSLALAEDVPNTDNKAGAGRHDQPGDQPNDRPDDRHGAQPTGNAPPDNTGVNKRDRQNAEVTADQGKNNKTDLEIARRIRRSIVSDKQLSTNAHNVKIITENGSVTLKGPVHSQAEKDNIEKKAADVAGPSKVKNEIEVKQ